MANALKPKVKSLGTCVIERNGKDFLVMFANGSVKSFPEYLAAVKSISKYFAKHTPKDTIGVGQMTSYDGSIETKVTSNGFVVNLW